MDGICRPLGGAMPVTLAGATWLAQPLTLGDFATIEYHQLARRPGPLETVLPHLDRLAGLPDAQQALVELASRDIEKDRGARCIPWADTLAWIDEPEGIDFTAWLCLRGSHPQRFETLELTCAILAAATAEDRREFARRRNMVSGLDALSAAELPSSAEGGKGPKWVPWMRWVRSLLDCYPGWTIATVANLTLFQARMLQAGQGDLGGQVKMSREEYAAFRKMRKSHE